MAKSNYPHKQRSGGSNRGALIALLVLLIIAAAVFLLLAGSNVSTPCWRPRRHRLRPRRGGGRLE